MSVVALTLVWQSDNTFLLDRLLGMVVMLELALMLAFLSAPMDM
jgi:hypothetical protein